MATPHVELLWWPGCPSRLDAEFLITEILGEFGFGPAHYKTRLIATTAEAQATGFVGSPTIRVNGVDVAPVNDLTPALNCRLYFHRNGRPSPLPDPSDLRDAVRTALLTS